MQQDLLRKQFKEEALYPENPKWEASIKRAYKISKNEYDIRSEFERDNNRILHSTAYRRLKDKTQVFFATNKDHICTRIEHVNHVASIARAVSKSLGLNADLAEAIAMGHDLGHTPFGHEGERVLEEIVVAQGLGTIFWHEKNSLRFIDWIETLPNYEGKQENLNLTYAVRDGIVCHCGEVDENFLKPRKEIVDLETMQKGKYDPYTYEGCVVKISDKIAYLGRDIEDAFEYRILRDYQIKELKQIVENLLKKKIPLKEINTTTLMYEFIKDLCLNSNPEDGLNFSDERYLMMNQIKKFNYENICRHKRLKPFKAYAKLILNTIFEFLDSYYDKSFTCKKLGREAISFPTITKDFTDWLIKYSNISLQERERRKFHNIIIYDIDEHQQYKQAIVDFISSMTDHYAIKVFEEIISF